MTTDSGLEEDSPWKWLASGWVKSALVLALLIVAFYVEEDWRGAAAWTDAKAQSISHGESLDPKRLIPPPIPDEENFGALPIFQIDASENEAVEMRNALALVEKHLPYSEESGQQADMLPYEGNWRRGEHPDLPAMQKKMIEEGNRLLPSTKIQPQATMVDVFSLLCPALSALREANAIRPDCRFDLEYDWQPAYTIPVSGVTSQIALAKVMAYEERLAFYCHRPELALTDLHVEWKINSGLQREPLLISGFVAMGVGAIQLEIVREGLAWHEWNDQQLTSLDTDLGKIDFLAEAQLCFRGDAILSSESNIDFVKERRTGARSLIFGPYGGPEGLQGFLFDCGFSLIPNGWFDQFKADYVRLILTGAVQIVNASERRVHPEREGHLETLIESSRSGHWIFLSNWFSTISSTTRRFAYSQVGLDEARIACRLERYHLAHGVYPDSLNALTPVYGSDLPRDIMTGEPYHYRLRGDGNYLLYSVGWDQKDDGGPEDKVLGLQNLDSVDWVWVNHPGTGKAK